MMKYFTISYKMSVKKPDGILEPISASVGSYVGNIMADTEEEAVDKLKEMFNMVHIDVLSCIEKSMTEEEYNAKAE